MKKRLTFLFITVILGAFAFGAGTLTETATPAAVHGLNRIEYDWTSDASGDVSGIEKNIYGYLLRVSFIPDSGGTQPSDYYDIELQDSDDIDLLNGAGANLSQTTSTTMAPTIQGDSIPVVMGAIELVVSNAGDSKGGTVVIYFQEP